MEVLKDIADEERVHAGEFLRLLHALAPDEKKFYITGAKEVGKRNQEYEGEENMKRILVAAFVILALLSGVVSAQENIEKKKIEFLISSVENLKGAKFIRNGSEYDGKKAAEHLRLKIKNSGGRVQTADDFIRLCASQSYMTGKPYMIRLVDGKTIKSEKYFREKLKEYCSTVKRCD